MIRFNPVARRKDLWGHLMWFLAWVGVTGFAIYLTPSASGHGTHTELGLPPCPSVLFLHRPCPGCGLTTSFTATVHGQFGAAFHAHPLGPLLYLTFTLSALACFYGWVQKKQLDTSSKSFNRFLGVFIVVFFAFGITRFALMGHYGDGEGLRYALSTGRSR